jgi:hypothetical protein
VASTVPRHALGEALIASLPQALRLSWPEVRARAGRASVPLSAQQARFVPEVDVFDGRRDPLTVRLVADVVLTPRRRVQPQAPADVTVHVTLSVAGPSQRVAFHEVSRDLVLPMPY